MSETNATLRGGALILPQGPTVPAPNAGERAIYIGTDGALTAKLADGTVSPAGGGVGWDAIQWQRIQALLGSQVADYQWTDLLNAAEYDVTTGTGPFAQLAASTGGVLKNGAGTATMYFASQKSAGGSVVPIPNIKTSAWAVAARCRFDATPAGAGKVTDVCGMLGTSQFASVQIDVDTSASVLQLNLTGAGTSRTACSSVGTIGGGLAVGTWFDVLLANDVSGARVVAQINGVTAASTSTLTNLTTEAGRAFFDTNQNTAISFDALMFAFKREP